MIDELYNSVKEEAQNGGVSLSVGTKKQAVELMLEEATRLGQFYVYHRWLGGTLTNWNTI